MNLLPLPYCIQNISKTIFEMVLNITAQTEFRFLDFHKNYSNDYF